MSPTRRRDGLKTLEEALGYTFEERGLLHRALTHRSFAHETGAGDTNEPLEFLGDAVLGYVVAERIYRTHAGLDEGGMTRLRSSLVNSRALAREAARLGIDQALELGKGEEKGGGRSKPSLLANAFEAVVGAILIDGGIRPVRRLIHGLFDDRIAAAESQGDRPEADAKTRLQEYAQARGWELPSYRLVEQMGPDHARVFTIAVVVRGETLGRGTGSTKKIAEQEAADRAFRTLLRRGQPSGG